VFVLEFLKIRLWDPMFTREGYNIYSTLFIAIIFIVAVEAYWTLFAKKRDQKKMRAAAIPFIIAGGAIRFLDSRAFPPSLATITPGIYFVLLLLFTLLIHFFGELRTEKIGRVICGTSLIVGAMFLGFSKALYVLPALAFTFAFSKSYLKLKIMKDGFAWIPHIFEAWITSFGVMAGLVEEHVFAGLLMSINPLVFGLFKSLVIPLIMYMIKDTEGKQKIYIGTVIGLIGLGPAVRDLLELLSL
jgi:uncharacterized membrane protein